LWKAKKSPLKKGELCSVEETGNQCEEKDN